MTTKTLRSIAVVLLALWLHNAAATRYVLPPPDVNIIGMTQTASARFEDTLMDVARDHSLGLDEILQANPALDRWIPGDGAEVVLPTRFILPDAPREGVVLNLAEKRLYYYPKAKPGEKPVVLTYPVGIGRMDWETPLGLTKITTKVVGPDWRPPQSIKLEHLQRYNEVLPDVVPAGPDNPLGSHALRLGIPGYLIHGSNKRYGVGSRVSHGCVRMYNEDISALFPQVPVGTPVNIVNQSVKVGQFAGSVFIEVHTPLEEDESFRATRLPTVNEVLTQIYTQLGQQLAPSQVIDHRRVADALDRASGIPTVVLN